jgi:hypothetical protein
MPASISARSKKIGRSLLRRKEGAPASRHLATVMEKGEGL